MCRRAFSTTGIDHITCGDKRVSAISQDYGPHRKLMFAREYIYSRHEQKYPVLIIDKASKCLFANFMKSKIVIKVTYKLLYHDLVALVVCVSIGRKPRGGRRYSPTLAQILAKN